MDTRSTSTFRPLVNCQVTYKIINCAGIVQAFTEQYEKPYLFFNFERTDVDSLEYYTWAINEKSDINNAHQVSFEYRGTNQKWFCIKTKQRYFRNTHG